MTYSETLEYLYTSLPMFQREGKSAFKKDLTNTRLLCDLCGNPQNAFRSVHVAGTNGKGSTSHMLAAVLQQAGYRVGLYTSPHLRDFRERIRVNGDMIPEQVVTDFVASYKADFERIQPSFFEMTVALAFSYFASQEVDIAVVEVGLGGRLDSTNIILPDLSVITNISFDHMDMLGNTLQAIAGEKAGIIKPGIPAVIGETHPETAPVFLNAAQQAGSHMVFADQHLEVVRVQETEAGQEQDIADMQGNMVYPALQLDLAGDYQQKNTCTVLTAIEQLQQIGWTISRQHIYHGIARAKSITGLLGRWQRLGTKPTIIADTGHNQAGLEYIARQLSRQPYQRLHMVIGMVKEKDVKAVLSLFPPDAAYYFCRPGIPRGLDAVELAAQAAEIGIYGQVYPTVKEALWQAKQEAGPNDLIFVGGSTFVVAEVV